MMTDLLEEERFGNFDFISFWKVQYINATAVLVISDMDKTFQIYQL
jgi:hypothetical protein